MMIDRDPYEEAVNKDIDHFLVEHAKQFESEQRSVSFLKSLIMQCVSGPVHSVGDFCGGMGQVSFHLSQLLPSANFDIIDSSEPQILHAKELFQKRGIKQLNARVGSVYTLEQSHQHRYDLSICWNTLFVLNDPFRAIQNIASATREGGHIFISSLFNNHEVDLFTEIHDYTRNSSQQGKLFKYNTLSKNNVITRIQGLINPKKAEFFDFEMDIDLNVVPKGLGTYTKLLDSGKRLQISGGMLMNWSVLHLQV